MSEDNAKSVPQEHSDTSHQSEGSASTMTFEERLLQKWRERVKKEMDEHMERINKAIEDSIKESLNPTQKTFQGIYPMMEIKAVKETKINGLKPLFQVFDEAGDTRLMSQEEKDSWLTLHQRFHKGTLPRWVTKIKDEKNILRFLENVKSLPARRTSSKEYLRKLARRHGLSAPLADAVVNLLVLRPRFNILATYWQSQHTRHLGCFQETFGSVVTNALMNGILAIEPKQNSRIRGLSEID